MNIRKILKAVLFPVLLAVILSFFLSSLSNLSDGRQQEDKKQLENALIRAAVACYAVEGTYPPNVQYLEDNYGIQINQTLYTVKYEVIASNLMPDITVIENQP
jgi:hypothetical protein